MIFIFCNFCWLLKKFGPEICDETEHAYSQSDPPYVRTGGEGGTHPGVWGEDKGGEAKTGRISGATHLHIPAPRSPLILPAPPPSILLEWRVEKIPQILFFCLIFVFVGPLVTESVFLYSFLWSTFSHAIQYIQD